MKVTKENTTNALARWAVENRQHPHNTELIRQLDSEGLLTYPRLEAESA